MKLRTVHVEEFKSIWDSNPFKVDSITCLVGKNEAGKTAVLQALYRLNPIVETDGLFDVTDDYPRSDVENYQQDIDSRRRTHAGVIKATFELESSELDAIDRAFGSGILKKPEIVLSKGYAKSEDGKTCPLFVQVPIDEPALVKNLVESFELPEAIKGEATQTGTVALLSRYLTQTGTKAEEAVTAAQTAANLIPDEAEKAAALEKSKGLAESEQAKALRTKVAELSQHKSLGLHIWQTILKPSFPKFLYFDEYYQMRGHDNIPALKRRKTENRLTPPDHPLLGLIELARLDLDALIDPART